MSSTFIAPSLTGTETFAWNDRTWSPVTEAIEPIEMYRHLHAPTAVFAYDSESARKLAFIGGTYDVSYFANGTSSRFGTFETYTVVNAGGGLVRLYRAGDERDLRNGSTW